MSQQEIDALNQQWAEERERKAIELRHGKLSDKEWEAHKRQFSGVIEPQPKPLKPQRLIPSSPEEAEEFAAADKYCGEQLAEAWELVREEAEATLKVNPQDEIAIRQLLRYHRRNKKGVIIKANTQPKTRTAIWKQMSQSGWVLRVAKSQVGDIVDVRHRDGTVKQFQLTKQINHNSFHGRECL